MGYKSSYIHTFIQILVDVNFLDQSELECLQRIGHPPSAPAISKVKGKKNVGAESSSHGAEVVHTSQPDTMDHTHILDSAIILTNIQTCIQILSRTY